MEKKLPVVKSSGFYTLIVTLLFVFIGIPIAFSSSTEQNGRIFYNANWSDEKNGVKTSIESVEVYRTEKVVDGGYDNELAVTYKIENTSDNTVKTFPEQGKLVIGNTQMSADITASDKIGGELLSGVVREGKVRFQLSDDIDVKAIEEIRLSWDHSASNTAGAKYDIKLKLEKQ